jgi:hypothetical protein
MRLIKRQTTNLINISGKGVIYDANNEIILDTKSVVLVPKGTTAERPLTPEDGHLRYNTQTNEFEVYQNSQWRRLRFKEPTEIYQNNLGLGDANETVFGPLDNNDNDFPVPASAQSMIVIVGGVFQIAGTNYDLVQSINGSLAGPNAPYADGWYIKFGTAPGFSSVVTALHNFDK